MRSNYEPGRLCFSSEGCEQGQKGGWRIQGEGGGGEEEREKKPILKYGHWHEQKFYPQHFHTMLWEMKKNKK